MNQVTYNILDYLADEGRPFIHAKGKVATYSLIKELNCQAGEEVLELGFGTGATLVELISRNKDIHVSGVEVNKFMFETTLKRLRFCGLKKTVRCTLIDKNEHLPFENESFDKVYCESVLGILEGEKLRLMIAEINRILKPGGRLVFNETIWLRNVLKNEIEIINEFCKKQFGIIQSNSLYSSPEDWSNLLLSEGFEVTKQVFVDSLEKTKAHKENLATILSSIFTLKRKGFNIFKKKRIKDDNPNHLASEKVMEGVIFVAIKTLNY